MLLPRYLPLTYSSCYDIYLKSMLVAYMYNSNVLCSYVIDIVSFYSQSMTLYYYAGTLTVHGIQCTHYVHAQIVASMSCSLS